MHMAAHGGGRSIMGNAVASLPPELSSPLRDPSAILTLTLLDDTLLCWPLWAGGVQPYFARTRFAHSKTPPTLRHRPRNSPQAPQHQLCHTHPD